MHTITQHKFQTEEEARAFARQRKASEIQGYSEVYVSVPTYIDPAVLWGGREKAVALYGSEEAVPEAYWGISVEEFTG